MKKDKLHEPVLVHEVNDWLHINNQARKVIDATLGTAGHALEMVKKNVYVLGIDADRNMIELAEERLEKACPTFDPKGGKCFKLVHGNFRGIDEIAQKEGFEDVDAVLFDLGVSTPQLTSTTRGFSFAGNDAPLDMRMDSTSQGLSAADLLNALRPDQLRTLFAKVLTDFQARKLVKKIVLEREKGKMTTVGDLLRVTKGLKGKPGLNPATLPFLALRMAVNSELENLEEALPKAFSLLRRGGRLLFITFHSGEEIKVVRFAKRMAKEGVGKILTKKPVVPSASEIDKNPSARSAKLWVIEKS